MSVYIAIRVGVLTVFSIRAVLEVSKSPYSSSSAMILLASVLYIVVTVVVAICIWRMRTCRSAEPVLVVAGL